MALPGFRKKHTNNSIQFKKNQWCVNSYLIKFLSWQKIFITNEAIPLGTEDSLQTQIVFNVKKRCYSIICTSVVNHNAQINHIAFKTIAIPFGRWEAPNRENIYLSNQSLFVSLVLIHFCHKQSQSYNNLNAISSIAMEVKSVCASVKLLNDF